MINLMKSLKALKNKRTILLSQCMEALHKFTTLESTSPEGSLLLNIFFISQLAPNIHYELQKVERSPQVPQKDLVILAFKVFNNRKEDIQIQNQMWEQAKAEAYQMFFSS